MPSGDEVTGLHAFDELDPVSTVSALNIMPEGPGSEPEVAEAFDADEQSQPASSLPPPRAARSAPPPPPPRPGSARPPAAFGRTLPPPLARAEGGGPLPPPPRGGLGGVSVP